MSGLQTFARYWLPVLIWMALIFTASSDTGSMRRSSRLIAPLVRWLFPGVAETTVDRIVFVARKGAHVTEFGVLALLVWRALRRARAGAPGSWAWSDGRRALLIAFLYAVLDEFHQLFVTTRMGSVGDVLLDTAGAGAALILLWQWGRWRRRW